MQKINLLYVITKLELGGAQKQLLDLIRHLDKEKFKPFLFSAQTGLLLPEALSIQELTIKKSKRLERAINPLKDFLALLELFYFIKKNNIRIVHTHSSKAGILGRLAAKLAKVKIILHTVHGWSFNAHQSVLKRKLFIRLERFAAQFTDKLIVVSNYDKQKGLERRIGREDKYALIRYGINYSEFNVTDRNIRKEFGISADDLVVGMVACFKPQKAPQDFIKLAYLVKKTLPNTRFLLVGDGVLRKEVERLIDKLNLQAEVILTGWRRDIPRIMSAIDIFVLTSLWEGLPIAVLEALVSSKPVIATHTGAVAEVIAEGKSGSLVSCRDIKTMSERLVNLLKNEGVRRQLEQSSKDFLDDSFRQENMIKDTENLYCGLIFN